MNLLMLNARRLICIHLFKASKKDQRFEISRHKYKETVEMRIHKDESLESRTNVFARSTKTSDLII